MCVYRLSSVNPFALAATVRVDVAAVVLPNEGIPTGVV